MPTTLRTSLLLAAIVLAAPACAKKLPAVQLPDAPLGRVVIYRNGVAYFERQAAVEGELRLSVPAARVDDFLKSLKVIDVASGKPLPLSYPTVSTALHGSVAMTITLPPGRRNVRIAYVTESPAWKPSYRVTLGKGTTAKLEARAIVDNVSDEAWRKVAVGVGSTSALSFRYDLHSVQTVLRETIDSGTAVATAPPGGGSPYAIGGSNVRVLADLGGDAIDRLALQGAIATAQQAGGISLEEAADAAGDSRDFTAVVDSKAVRSVRHKRGGKRWGNKAAKANAETPPPVAQAPADPSIDGVAGQLASNAAKIRVEGWAGATDTDRPAAGLRRANALRDALVARGVASERIEVVGHDDVAAAEHLVRIVEVDESEAPAQARVETQDDGMLGDAQFMTATPMTIEAGHSAMVTLFDSETSAARVYMFDPISERGSARYAFNAVRVVNPTDDTLDGGPITVYAEQRFLGEGITEPIPPRAATLVPYGLDRSMVVAKTAEVHEEIEAFRTIERGIATTLTQRIRQFSFEVTNRGQATARVFVRHRVESGWTLRDAPAKLERLGTDVLVPIDVPAGKSATLVLAEATPISTAVDLRSATGVEAVTRYLEHHAAGDDLGKTLKAIVDAQHQVTAVDETLQTRRTHAAALRGRIDELGAQLLALRKVDRGQNLSSHLAKRIRELVDRLDRVATEISDLENRQLEHRIEVDGMIAELSFRAERGESAVAADDQRSRTASPKVARTTAGATR